MLHDVAMNKTTYRERSQTPHQCQVFPRDPDTPLRSTSAQQTAANE